LPNSTPRATAPCWEGELAKPGSALNLLLFGPQFFCKRPHSQRLDLRWTKRLHLRTGPYGICTYVRVQMALMGRAIVLMCRATVFAVNVVVMIVVGAKSSFFKVKKSNFSIKALSYAKTLSKTVIQNKCKQCSRPLI
jgi:hypothetical protein